MFISSLNNEKIKYYQKLLQKKYRDQEKLFLVEDEHLVKEALKNNIVKEIITTLESNKYDIPTLYVTENIMAKLSTQVTSTKVIAVCHMLEEKKIKGNVIVLDRIQDPGNLGTIIRSAVAFNFDSVILSNDSVDLYNPKVIRASEGMIFNVNIIRTNISEFLDKLDKDYLKITTSVKSGKKIQDINFKKCAIIIGNEGSGVSDEVASKCDEKVSIKMNDACESLNAGVSASILMYEVNND